VRGYAVALGLPNFRDRLIIALCTQIEAYPNEEYISACVILWRDSEFSTRTVSESQFDHTLFLSWKFTEYHGSDMMWWSNRRGRRVSGSSHARLIPRTHLYPNTDPLLTFSSYEISGWTQHRESFCVTRDFTARGDSTCYCRK
jgi:hypothetical protein